MLVKDIVTDAVVEQALGMMTADLDDEFVGMKRVCAFIASTTADALKAPLSPSPMNSDGGWE